MKSLTELLKRELSTRGLELLDIYVFRDKDFLRLLDKKTSRVLIYELPRKLSSITSASDIKTLVLEIEKKLVKS